MWFPKALSSILAAELPATDALHALGDSFHHCDAHLEVASYTDPWWDDSGSTASLALLQQDMLLLANAGDSSTLLVQRGGTCKRFSARHNASNPAEYIEVKCRGGRISSKSRIARVYNTPSGRVGSKGCTVTRALGDFTFKYPIQALVAQPEVHSHHLDPERDLLVMSVTDGVTDFISDHELGKLAWRSLQEVVGESSKPEEWASSVAADVLAEVKRRGLALGRQCPVDNCSVAVAALGW